MIDGYIPLTTGRTWDSNSATPVKISVGYVYARDLNNGKVTYNICVDIDPLPKDNYGQQFGYEIYGQVYMRNGATTWTRLSWGDDPLEYTHTFKGVTPYNWNSPLTQRTANVQFDASPGDNVQLMVHIYSRSELYSRNKVFLWGEGIPDESTKQVSTRSDHVSSTPLNVPDPAGASLSSVPNLTISSTASQDLSFTCTNLIASYYYRLTATLNGVVIRMHDFVKGQSSGTITVEFGSEHIQAALNAMPTSASGNIQYALSTYSSAGRTSQIGTTSYKSGMCVINTASIKPSISSVSTSRRYRGGNSPLNIPVYIQGVIQISIDSVSATAGYGSAISRYDVTIGTKTYSSVTTPFLVPLEEAGTKQFSIRVYDSRNAASNSFVVGEYYVYEYHTPQIPSYTAERCGSGGTLEQDGTYFKVNAEFDISDVALYPMVYYSGAQPAIAAGSYVQFVHNNETHAVTPTSVFDLFVADTSVDNEITIKVKNTAGPVTFRLLDGATTIDSATAITNAELVRTYDLTGEDINSGSLYATCSMSSSTNRLTVNVFISHNTPQFSVAYKPTSASAYGVADARNVFSEGFSGVFGDGQSGGQMLPDTSYDLRYALSDRFSEYDTVVQDYLSSAEYTLFLAKGGKAISIGEAYSPAEGSTDKVLNISDDWVINRGGEPSFYTANDGWTVHNLGEGYVEMWGKIVCGNTSPSSQQVLGWTRLASSDIYYSTTRWCKVYPNTISFAEAPLVTATVRTYYTPGADGQESLNHPNLWVVTDAQDSTNTEAQQLLKTPDYVLARVGSLTQRIDAEIALHVFGKLASS